MASRKPASPTKPDDPEEYRRFVETARELGADESRDAMDRAFERVVGRTEPKHEPKKPPKDRSSRT